MTVRPHLPSPSNLREPVDAGALAELWAKCDVPPRVAESWARHLPPEVGEQVLAFFDAERAFRLDRAQRLAG